MMLIQGKLIKFYHRFQKGGVLTARIKPALKKRLLAILGRLGDSISVKLIQQYNKLTGKTTRLSIARSLHNRIASAVNRGTIDHDDPYWDEIENTLTHLRAFVHHGKTATLQHRSIKIESLNGIDKVTNPIIGPQELINSTDLVKLKFDSIGFKGKWLNLIGDPTNGFTTMIYGKPKFGKSYLAIDLAFYLAKNHGTVLYVASEEQIGATLQLKVAETGSAHPDLFFIGSLPERLDNYDFVFIDSVNNYNLSPSDLRDLKSKNPKVSFIYIFQSTKHGMFRGGNEFQHDVDVVIEVPEIGKATQFGRFNQGGEMNIFKRKS